MTTATAPQTTADLARVEEVMAAWKPFCSPAGCACEKAADCAYCAACIESDRAGDEAYAAYLAEQAEQARPFWEFLYGDDEA